MPWSDCADAQADLDICCPHMPEDRFSLVEALIKIMCVFCCADYKVYTVSKEIEKWKIQKKQKKKKLIGFIHKRRQVL